jgi:hypothetical protein
VSNPKTEKSSGKFKPGRKPHNVAVPIDRSLKDIVLRVANERHAVTIDGVTRNISRMERTLRLTVDRAVKGNKKDILRLLQIVAKRPDMAASIRTDTIVFFNGAMAEVWKSI